MHYALARVVGAGTDADPFRPPTDQHISTIDLRPDPTARDGWMLVATAEREARTGIYLGDDPQALSPAVARLLTARLGVQLDADPTLAELAAELLTKHARTDGTRWRPLAPRRGFRDNMPVHRYEVALGGQRIWQHEIPRLMGAATIADDFNKSNSSTVGPDLTWVEQVGSWQVTSNRLAINSGGFDAASIFADAPLASDDHWAHIDFLTGSGEYAGITVRNRYPVSGGRNHYIFDYKQTANTIRLTKRVNDTLTTLQTANHNNSLPVYLYAQADGSTILGDVDNIGLNNNGNPLIMATDTSLSGPSYVRAGVKANASSNSYTFDNFGAGDLQAQIMLDSSLTPTGAVVKKVPKVFGGTVATTGALLLQKIVLRIFGGNLGGLGVKQYPYLRGYTFAYPSQTSGVGLRGELVKSPARVFDGVLTPVGALARTWQKLFRGSVAPTAWLGRSPVRIFGGTIVPTGDILTRALGRIFGRPGVVRATVRIAGEVRARVRRG